MIPATLDGPVTLQAQTVPSFSVLVSDTAIALTPKFTFASYNQWFGDTSNALNIKPAA
jgi:hypothetical protein